MASLFLSHSSHDKEFARKLSADLRELGHQPWLDEWEIRVGDCIISAIETGIERADYVIIVLSRNSVASGWVEREWKSKYWQEIEDARTRVLPVLIEDCEIPVLLKTKKYADFRLNHSVGLASLAAGIVGSVPVVPTEPPGHAKAVHTVCIVLAKGFSRRWFVPVPVWVFIAVPGEGYARFKGCATLKDLDPLAGNGVTEFSIHDYGVVLEMGSGTPSASTIRKMEYEYGYSTQDSGVIGKDERVSRTLIL